jgi:hypothetical protein
MSEMCQETGREEDIAGEVEGEEMKPWVVYGLIDPRIGWIFYIGITRNLQRRLTQHQTRRQSAAWEMCNDIAASGAQVSHCIFGSFPAKKFAEFLEKSLITCIPQTYNKTYFGEAVKFWEPLAIEYGLRGAA